jgi:hypothetical protein
VRFRNDNNRFNVILKGGSNQKGSSILMSAKPAFMSKKTFPANVLPVESLAILSVLWACIHGSVCRDALKSFFIADVTWVQQRGLLSVKNAHWFRCGEWVRFYIHETALKLVNHFGKRTLVERYIISVLRKSTDQDGVLTNIIASDYDFSSVADLFPLCDPESISVKKKENMIWATLKLPGLAGKLDSALNFGCYSAIVNNIFMAINHYGFDPDFENHQVHPPNQDDTVVSMYQLIEHKKHLARAHIDGQFSESEKCSAIESHGLKFHPIVKTSNDAGGDVESVIDTKKTYHAHFEFHDHFLGSMTEDKKEVWDSRLKKTCYVNISSEYKLRFGIGPYSLYSHFVFLQCQEQRLARILIPRRWQKKRHKG